MIKRLLHITFLVFFLLLLGCEKKGKERESHEEGQTSVLQNILQKKTIRVAILNNSIDYFLYRGTPMGFHYELARTYAEQLNVEVAMTVAKDYSEALKLLESGECDLLASNVGITRSRKQKMLFSSPLLRSNSVLVQNRNSKNQYVEDWLDTDTLHIGIVTESTSERIMQNIEEDLGICFQVAYFTEISEEDLIEKVAKDSIFATFSDKMTAKVAKTYYPNLDISIDASLPHNMAWALPSGALELQKNLNTWLQSFKKTRKFRQLYTKYFLNKKSILRNKDGQISSSKQLSKYDEYIKKEAQELGWDWRLLAALIYTESRFDASQVSWAGAFGIMQMMPITAHSFGASRTSSVQEQLGAGRKYLHYLEEEFAQSMTDKTDLKLFVLGAYNSGTGHIIDAQNLAEKHGKDKDRWNEVVPYILLLNKPKYYKDKEVKYGYFRGQETVNHVERIKVLYESYKSLIQ